MKLAVLTYYDRNYVVDTSLASSAKISFYILMLSIFQSSISYNTFNVFNVTKFCWLQILKYLQFYAKRKCNSIKILTQLQAVYGGHSLHLMFAQQ